MSPRTSFIGRAQETSAVERQVRANPLVTLTGSGGVGKTRLALEVAEVLRADALDGVFLVELAVLPVGSSSAEVEERFLAALGWPTLDEVFEWASSATALLVVDNCEHVADAAAAVVEQLIGRGPELRLLATSRLPLEVPAEQVVIVEPLAETDAVALLRERATSAGAQLGGIDGDLERLCRRLDGLPLALELAATRLRSLTPAEVEAGLVSSGRLLRQERQAFGRHAGMDEAIAWSFELLDPGLQRLFLGLSVFPGRFGLDDVVAVLGVQPTTRIDLADQLDRLVAHSLVVVDTGRRRYRLLVPVRQLALEWLVDMGDFDRVEQRLIDHLVAEAVEITRRGLEEPWTEDVMTTVFDLGADLRAAARRCIEIDDDPSRAFTLFIPSWAIVHHRDVTAIGRVGDELLDRWPEPGPPLWAEVAAIGATAHLAIGDAAEVRRLVGAALDAAPGPSIAALVALRALSLTEALEGDFAAAYAEATTASEWAGELGLDGFRIELDSHRGGFLSLLGENENAREVLLRALDESRSTQSILVELATLQLLAEHHLDDPVRCEAYLEAIDERLEPDSIVDTSWSRRITSGQLALSRGDTAAAARAFAEALRLARSAGDRRDAWRAIRGLGVTAAAAGRELAVAARLLAAADAEPVAPQPGAAGRRRLDAARAVVAHIEVEPAAHPVELAYELAETLMASERADAESSEAATAAVPDRPSLVAEGGTVRIRWGDSSHDFRPMKGLSDLARLLSLPGREIHVLELMGAALDEADAGPLIDPLARRRYEARLHELQEELHTAEDNHDLGRAEHLQAEFDAVVAALSEGLGLGGRERKVGASAEKARQAVSWRLRAAIKRIESELPSCGRHLRNSVKTGAFCRYEPEVDPGWVVSD